MKKAGIIESVLLLALCLMPFTGSGVVAQMSGYKLRISEFMAANDATIKDPDYGQFSDWIEIHNLSDSAINLQGFFLTDDLMQPFKWRVEQKITIRPHKYTVLWADGKNGGRHTNFKLAKKGEQIGLFAPDSSVIDSLSYSSQYPDISFGWVSADSNWYFFNPATPNLPNSSAHFLGFLSAPQFSKPAGFYPNSQSVELFSSDPSVAIRYTRDGTTPTEKAKIYTEPILLDDNTVLRARCFKNGFQPGPIVTSSYFINENSSLPVVSIVTDPVNLWDDRHGIYVAGTNGITGYCSRTPKNWNQDWERSVHFEFFEPDGRLGFQLNAGMKIGGGCTRKYPQKALAIYVRSKYGAGKIHYKLFPDKPIDRFNNLSLRNFGQDWYRTLFRDAMLQAVVKDRMDVDWQAHRFASVFLNGEYWGIYNIREKHNEHYLESNYGLPPREIDILAGNAAVKQGSAVHYKNMINFLKSHDISLPENYRYIAIQMDINNYIDYQIAEIYFANFDWPAGNIKYWRPQTPDGKWRWILHDLDLSFGAHPNGRYDSNTLENATTENGSYYSNPPWATFLLRTLLKNVRFRDEFIQRFAAHIHATFAPPRILAFIEKFKNEIAAEVPRHKKRWPDSMSLGTSWEDLIDVMREFAGKRPEYIRSFIRTKFNLTGTANLTVQTSDSTGGQIYLNGVAVPGEDVNWQFFRDVPIRVQAVAKSGYRFLKWQGCSHESGDSIMIVLKNDTSLTALFIPDSVQTEVSANEPTIGQYRLAQNYPNPFNLTTRISFYLPEEKRVKLSVYDLLGNEVAILLRGKIAAGEHNVQLRGNGLSSGIYLYQLRAEKFLLRKKLLLLK